MKILFDFGHPADVHYFRHLIFYLEKNGNEVEILARDKDVTLKLLENYQLSFINKGRGGTGLFDRLAYTLRSLQTLRKAFHHFKPDICISHASPYLALVAAFSKTPHIMFNDTEKAFLFDKVVKYLKPRTYSPDSFHRKEHKDLNLFDSYMELAYLHPDLFEPDESIKDLLGESYVLLRFVANKATHDIGHVHLNHDYKRELVYTLGKFTKVWISSEDPLPEDLKPYNLKVAPSKIHDVVACSELVISEGATVCSEAAMLGIPSVFINQNTLGYISELDKEYQLVDHFSADKNGRQAALERAVALLKDPDRRETYLQRRQRMLATKKNLTKLMIEIVENVAGEIGKEIHKNEPAI